MGGQAGRRADGRRDGRAAFRRDGRADGRKKRTFVLTDESSRVLDLHCLAAGLDRSAVVESLILAHCDRFVLYPARRPGPGEAAADRPAGTEAA